MNPLRCILCFHEPATECSCCDAPLCAECMKEHLVDDEPTQ